VQAVREVYTGELTSSANWGGEEMSKQWWDVIDYIGVDAYYSQGRSNGIMTPE